MKIFMNKLKKTKKVLLTLLILTIIIYIVSYTIFTINLIHLSSIETLIRIILLIIFGAWFFIFTITGFMSLIQKKYKTYIIMMIFSALFIVGFNIASYYIGTLYSSISEMSKEKVTYSSSLITMKNKELKDDSTIGMINNENDIEGYTLGNELLKEYNIKNQIKMYDDYFVMLHDLYQGTIDGAIVSGNYTITFSTEEEFENIAEETKVYKTISKEMVNQDNVSYTNKKLTEPFTVLLMGVDSNIDGLNANQAFNGDTLMMITFNPKTLNASVFSVPRDTYVPIACRNGAYAKINSSAAYGTSCVISTIKQLTGIDIDFYVKINFKGVVDLVEALNGVTVDVEPPYFRVNNGIDYQGKVCEQNSNREFDDKMVCMDPGLQRLNGEQALAYSRNRHQYIGSDLDRVKHQQQVVAAMANELKQIRTFEQFQQILKVVEKNIDTNMTNDQILSLYNVAKKIVLNTLTDKDTVSINKTYLETYSLPVWQGYSNTSALGYYGASLDEITKMMRVNLELEKDTPNKTYEIDYNENYTSKFYGEKLRSNPIEKTMANLIGMNVNEAQNWCNNNGLHANIEYVNTNEVGQNIVANQSIHVDTLINNLSSITLYVNNKENSNNNSENTSKQEENNNNNNNNNENEFNNIPSLPNEEKLTPSETKPEEKETEQKEEKTDIPEEIIQTPEPPTDNTPSNESNE